MYNNIAIQQPIIINNKIVYNQREYPFYLERISLIKNQEDLNQSFLDVGCQAGLDCFHLKEFGVKNITGIDINKDYIDFAKNNYHGITFINNDISNIKQHYDVILFLNYFCYKENVKYIYGLEGLDYNTIYIDLAPQIEYIDKFKRIYKQREILNKIKIDYNYEIIKGDLVDLIKITK